jgi:hypothetical protein
LVLTDAATGEGLRCVAVSPGDVIVADRGDAWVRNFAHLQAVGFGDLPATDPALARPWLLAQLIVAVLSEDLAQQVLAFPP